MKKDREYRKYINKDGEIVIKFRIGLGNKSKFNLVRWIDTFRFTNEEDVEKFMKGFRKTHRQFFIERISL